MRSGTIHNHSTATKLAYVCYQYPHDNYNGNGHHGPDSAREHRWLVRALEWYEADEGRGDATAGCRFLRWWWVRSLPVIFCLVRTSVDVYHSRSVAPWRQGEAGSVEVAADGLGLHAKLVADGGAGLVIEVALLDRHRSCSC